MQMCAGAGACITAESSYFIAQAVGGDDEYSFRAQVLDVKPRTEGPAAAEALFIIPRHFLTNYQVFPSLLYGVHSGLFSFQLSHAPEPSTAMATERLSSILSHVTGGSKSGVNAMCDQFPRKVLCLGTRF